jgi:hypothetical protein
LAAQSEALQQLMAFFRVARERIASTVRQPAEHKPFQNLTQTAVPRKTNGSAVEPNFTRF